MSESTPQSAELIKELDVPIRFGVAREWALTAEEVAQRTQDAGALKVWAFINDRTTLGVPMPEGGVYYYFTEKPERPYEEYAYLTPILESDVKRLAEDDSRRKLAEGKYQVAALYREKSQAIYLPPSNFGTLGKGILMLHEGMHAQLDVEGMVDRKVEDSHWAEEAEVYKLEFSLLNKLLGDDYTELVERIVGSIGYAEDNPNRLVSAFKPSDSDRKLIANGLMTADDNETDFWLKVASQQAFWEYFKAHVDDPDAELATMLKAVHGRLLPSN